MKIETEREVDGRWIAEISNLPGVMSYGDTLADAIAKAKALAAQVILEGNEIDAP
jgi:predicted RNase H-like HicB family nuclease